MTSVSSSSRPKPIPSRRSAAANSLLLSLSPIHPPRRKSPSPSITTSSPPPPTTTTPSSLPSTKRELPAADMASSPSSPSSVPSSDATTTMTAHQHDIGVRDVEDREGVHSGGVDGVEYEPGWLGKLQVLGRVGSTVVRGIDSDDLAHIEELHASLDVPETSLFPWLHGIGDGNYSLDAFFSSFSSFKSQLPAPRYRGVTVVQAPGPGDHSPASSSSEWVDGHSVDGHTSRSLTSSSSASEAGTSWISSSSVSSFPASVSSSSSSDTNDKNPDCSPSPSPSSSPQLHPQISTVGLNVGLSTLEPEPIPSTSVAAVEHTPRNVLGCSVPASEVFTLTPVPTLASSQSSRRPSGSRRQPSRRGRPSRGFDEDVDLATPDGMVNGERCKGQFVRRRVGETISLRNLGLQVAKYATISDIVIYHPDGLCSSALNVAERAAEALEDVWHERKMAMEIESDPVRYNIFVVLDSFKAIEAKHPNIVAIDSDGVVRNAVDLFAKEKQETTDLTTAMEVSPGFWMGNTNDCPLPYGSDGDGPKNVKIDDNPVGYDICIEAFDQADVPDHRRLAHAQHHLDTLASQSSLPSHRRSSSNPLVQGLDQLRLSLDSNLSSFSGDDDRQQHRRRQSSGDWHETELIYHMSCVSTSLGVPQGDWKGLNHLAAEMIDLARWVQKQTAQGKKVLMHGFDGYTESSIFALSLIMLINNISLPEAYLHLHLKSGRSFFVFAHDLPLLRKIDDRLSHERSSTNASSSSASSTLSVPPVLKWKGGWSLGSWTWKDEQASQLEAAAHTKERREAEIEKHASWFNDSTFEGSLPSRIIPFLYLGNIFHASNPLMLHALGITHVVSVGECALLDPRAPPLGPHHQTAPNHALWHEHQAGRIKVLDMKSISDDGISPLRPAIAETVAWMEQARLEGGKVLVHCKVGVSRSATVVIAYMMKHQGYSLVDAYMRTRARRLNVLIQPNLKFLYELQGWEVELSREQVEADQAQKLGDSTSSTCLLPRAKGRKMMSFPILCREIAAINRRYLGPGP